MGGCEQKTGDRVLKTGLAGTKQMNRIIIVLQRAGLHGGRNLPRCVWWCLRITKIRKWAESRRREYKVAWDSWRWCDRSTESKLTYGDRWPLWEGSLGWNYRSTIFRAGVSRRRWVWSSMEGAALSACKKIEARLKGEGNERRKEWN